LTLYSALFGGDCLYIGNGVTKEFPLPEGCDGSVVHWIVPDVKTTKMKEGEAYTVHDGIVFFAWRLRLGGMRLAGKSKTTGRMKIGKNITVVCQKSSLFLFDMFYVILCGV